ncbi:MAG: hypothetical protein A2X32_09710 [Elusimicrobia bacterium GWC2_64_44]|nr:MAG: hypothetical protein A2X32_09710 [Elusimicrobia bacterium GWC2_64_44]
MTETLPTSYLPAERASAAELARQAGKLPRTEVSFEALDSLQSFCMVLNRFRQVVHINKSFLAFLKEYGMEGLVGKRPGDLFGCLHASQTPGGCGTTDFCRRCGSAVALGEALRGRDALKECRILSRRSGEDLDLRVSVHPFAYGGEEFILMSVDDISAEKRREALERLLFKDLLETAGSVRGLVDLLVEERAGDPLAQATAAAAGRLLERIFSQKELDAAERGELFLRITGASAAGLLSDVAAAAGEGEEANGKKIVVAGDRQDVELRTDKALVTRVLGHLVKNALEAERTGATITLTSRATQEGAAFIVRNPAVMPEEARLQVFQRSFSSKGPGRGLGTYGVRLFTEKYLHGKVSFTSGTGGTEFRAEIPAEI